MEMDDSSKSMSHTLSNSISIPFEFFEEGYCLLWNEPAKGSGGTGG